MSDEESSEEIDDHDPQIELAVNGRLVDKTHVDHIKPKRLAEILDKAAVLSSLNDSDENTVTVKVFGYDLIVKPTPALKRETRKRKRSGADVDITVPKRMKENDFDAVTIVASSIFGINYTKTDANHTLIGGYLLPRNVFHQILFHACSTGVFCYPVTETPTNAIPIINDSILFRFAMVSRATDVLNDAEFWRTVPLPGTIATNHKLYLQSAKRLLHTRLPLFGWPTDYYYSGPTRDMQAFFHSLPHMRLHVDVKKVRFGVLAAIQLCTHGLHVFKITGDVRILSNVHSIMKEYSPSWPAALRKWCRSDVSERIKKFKEAMIPNHPCPCCWGTFAIITSRQVGTIMKSAAKNCRRMTPQQKESIQRTVERAVESRSK